MNTQPTAPCVRHPQAPVIGGMCGGCTVVPSERAVPLLADVQPAVSGVSSEEAAANVTAAVPVLAAAGLPAAEACTDPRHTGSIRAQLGCTGPDPADTDEADEEGQEPRPSTRSPRPPYAVGRCSVGPTRSRHCPRITSATRAAVTP